MRRIVTVFLSLVMLLSCTMAFAATTEKGPLPQFMNAVEGSWCDQNGHRMVVFGDYMMNGIRVSEANNVAGDQLNGSATITIIGRTGVDFVNVYWNTVAGKRSINMGGNMPMVPFATTPQYPETIGGLHLDMTEPELSNKYGPGTLLTPSETMALCGINAESWYYKDIGLLATFDQQTFTVDRLILVKGATTAFDISALNADSPLYKYAAIYGWSYTPAPGDVVDMGHGQSMNFKYYPQAVMIQLSSLN
ncbi:MAG: hypothetical protein J6N55_09260 [Anaerovibrio sp.]|uniref:hypothetical protein n=1 Tax=Anaerovibrio sp. TaxID=1872532 RepID=UPI001B176507|nr:hypothetical protein [Anaerovibrio sp.]MBO6246453.1 hypothetical protein [Anaerovibrio sp.]